MRLFKSYFSLIFLFAFLSMSLTPVPETAQLETTAFEAPGHHETLLHIHKLGRYSIQASGGHGMALSLYDRRSGPVARDGEVGERDGRIDVFLEKGTYKVKLRGPDNGKGTAALAVKPYVELHETLPLLPIYEVLSTELKDLEARSFLVQLPGNDTFHLEAMGRNLSAAKLWVPDHWETGKAASARDLEPISGQPMKHLEFHQRLQPGQYMVTFYGGPKRAWAKDAPEQPLHLRFGVKKLTDYGYHEVTMSPFGRDHFRVGKDAGFFEVQRKDKAYTQMERRDFASQDGIFNYSYQSAQITKEARTAYMSMSASNVGNDPVITLIASPGDALRFQYFREGWDSLDRDQRYFVSLLPGLQMDDTFEATGMVVAQGEQILNQEWRELGAGSGIARRMNMLSHLTMLVDVQEEGDYVFRVNPNSTAEVSYRLVSVAARERGKAPEYKDPSEPQLLTAGLHILEISPKVKGILDFALFKEGEDAPLSKAPSQNDHLLRWDIVDTRGLRYGPSLRFFGLEGMNHGVQVRKLPVDLNEALIAEIAPGRPLETDIAVRTPRRIKVTGGSVRLQLDGNPLGTKSVIQSGRYRLTVASNETSRKRFMIETVSAMDAKPSEIVDFSASLRVLEPGAPIYEDFNTRTPRFFLLKVMKPGLYRVETMGRMAMGVWIRTRIAGQEHSGVKNGVGRNGLVQAYLPEGEYLVTVQPQGVSKGRAGIQVRRTELRDGPPLLDHVVRRVTLPSDHAIRYPFEIEEAGSYGIDHFGLGKSFVSRIEDGDGFPIRKPWRQANQNLHFEPGNYSFYTLPEAVESRRLTRLRHPLKTPVYDGKGPHALVMNRKIDALWRKGAPDVFEVEIPAKTPVKAWISKGMKLVGVMGGEQVFELANGEGKTLELGPGALRMEATRLEDDDYFDYALQLSAENLILGVPKKPGMGSYVYVDIAEDGLYDITSYGRSDVYAYFYGKGVNYVDVDDREDDWNFRISQRMKAGRHTLYVAEHNNDRDTTLTIQMRESRDLDGVSVPFKKAESLGREVLRLPLRLEADGLAHFKAEAKEGVTLAIVRDVTLGQGVSDLRIPLKAGEDYTLLAWYDGEGSGRVTLSGRVDVLTEQVVTDGYALKGGVQALRDEAGGLWRLAERGGAFSSDWEVPLLVGEGDTINLYNGMGWVEGARGKLERVVLKAGGAEDFPAPTLPMRLGFAVGAGQVQVLHLQSLGRDIAAMFEGGEEPYRWDQMAGAGQRVWLAKRGDTPGSARVWSPSGERPSNVTARMDVYDVTTEAAFKAGEGGVAPKAATRLDGVGDGVMEVVLTEGMMALFERDNGPYRLLHAGEALRTNVTLRGGSVTLINPTSVEGHWRLRKLDVPVASMEEAKTDFESWFAGSGELRIPLEKAERYQVVGAIEEAIWYGGDGRSFKVGESFEASDHGVLAVRHGAGMVKLWQGDDAKRHQRMFGAITQESGALPNDVQGLSEARSWTVEASARSLLALRVDSGVTQIEQGDRILAVGDQKEQLAAIDGGTTQVSWRPVNGQLSRGNLSHQLVPIDGLKDGNNNPLRLIGNGEYQAWSFTIEDKTKIGLGLKTDSDRVNAELFDSDFKSLATGPYLFRELEPGRYHLIVKGEGPPVRYQPLLYGLGGPRDAIPQDVMAKFKNVIEAGKE